MEIVFRVQRLAEQPAPGEVVRDVCRETSPLIGDGRLERAGPTIEIAHPDPAEELADDEASELEYAVEVTYEGLYELAEETLADGASTLLDEHFGALGGWIASTLVRLGDLSSRSSPPTTAAPSSGRRIAGRLTPDSARRRPARMRP